jgi:hypothetical protein
LLLSTCGLVDSETRLDVHGTVTAPDGRRVPGTVVNAYLAFDPAGGCQPGRQGGFARDMTDDRGRYRARPVGFVSREACVTVVATPPQNSGLRPDSTARAFQELSVGEKVRDVRIDLVLPRAAE